MFSVSFVAAAQTSQPILSRISLIVQIAFLAFTGLLAFLSYRTARRTIFQPLRVEIFKRQIDELSQILKMFTGKGETDLWEDHHFSELIMANMARMYDDYAFHAFNATRPKESREYRHELCPVSRFTIPESGVIDGLEVLTNYTRIDRSDNPATTEAKPDQDNKSGSKEKPREWIYKNPETHLPRGYVEREQQFEDLIDNPLCPKSIVALLEQYKSNADRNVTIISEVIRECAHDMPGNYPTVEELKNAEWNWITNRIIGRRIKMEPTARLIIAAVRSYFDPDNLLRQSRPMAEILRSAIHRSKQSPDHELGPTHGIGELVLCSRVRRRVCECLI